MNTHSRLLGAACLAAFSFATTGALAQDGFQISFADPAWDGQTIPEGQHCALQGGEGATPALELSGLPEGTTTVEVAFNDESFEPMNNGGHGTIGFEVEPVDGTATLQSVPGGTEDLPEGVFIAAPNATSGDFLTAGYMPPCSGGQGNTYSATVSALDAEGNTLASETITLGQY